MIFTWEILAYLDYLDLDNFIKGVVGVPGVAREISILKTHHVIKRQKMYGRHA